MHNKNYHRLNLGFNDNNFTTKISQGIVRIITDVNLGFTNHSFMNEIPTGFYLCGCGGYGYSLFCMKHVVKQPICIFLHFPK